MAEAEGRTRSNVWDSFVKLPEKNKAKCKLCSKELAFCGGTTNLREHLIAKHALALQNENKPASQNIRSFLKPTRCNEAKAEGISERIAEMIAMDMRPIQMVEGTGFRKLMSYLEPGYTVPSRKSFTMRINRKHTLGKAKLESMLNEVLSVALTTDIWTSIAVEAYMTVTVHYLDSDWEMQSFVLETIHFPERHTGVNIAAKLQEIGERWEITDQVVAVVHDQASNMEVSMEILRENEGWNSVFCSAHCLQLCLKSGLDINIINRLLGASRKIVTHFHHSVVASEALKQKQEQMNVKGKKLVTSSATRWNSSLAMLDRLLKLRWPVTAVLSDEEVTKRSDRYLDLTNEQYGSLRVI